MCPRSSDPRYGPLVVLQPTKQRFLVEGVECRLWVGETDDGRACFAMVYRFACEDRGASWAGAEYLVEKQKPRMEEVKDGPVAHP
jgi:hypothetical protein